MVSMTTILRSLHWHCCYHRLVKSMFWQTYIPFVHLFLVDTGRSWLQKACKDRAYTAFAVKTVALQSISLFLDAPGTVYIRLYRMYTPTMCILGSPGPKNARYGAQRQSMVPQGPEGKKKEKKGEEGGEGGRPPWSTIQEPNNQCMVVIVLICRSILCCCLGQWSHFCMDVSTSFVMVGGCTCCCFRVLPTPSILNILLILRLRRKYVEW